MSISHQLKTFQKKKSPEDKLAYANAIIAKLHQMGTTEDDSRNAEEFFEQIFSELELMTGTIAKHSEFISTLVSIIRAYSTALSPDRIVDGNFYHETYVKTITLLVGMVEQSQSLKTFVDALLALDVFVPAYEALASILPLDTSYPTQEISIDILGRIFMYMVSKKHSGRNTAEENREMLLNVLPGVIRSAFEDPSVGPKAVIEVPRDILNELNRDSAHIRSFRFASFGYECHGPVAFNTKLSSDGWLDMSKDYVSAYVPEVDSLIKFPYHDIAQVHCSIGALTLQIVLDKIPDRLEELRRGNVDDQDDDKGGARGKKKRVDLPAIRGLYVEFGDGQNEVLDAALDVFRLRLADAEEKIITARKEARRGQYAMISSRDQVSPEIVDAAMRGLRKGSPAVTAPLQGGRSAVGRRSAACEDTLEPVTSPEKDQEDDVRDGSGATARRQSTDGGYSRHVTSDGNGSGQNQERAAPTSSQDADAASVAQSGRVLRAATKPAPTTAPAREGTKRLSAADTGEREREREHGEREHDNAAAPGKRRRISDPANLPESGDIGDRRGQADVDEENEHPNVEAKNPVSESRRRRFKKPDVLPLQEAAKSATKSTPQPTKQTAKVTSRQDMHRGKHQPQLESPQPSPSPMSPATKKAKMRAPGAESVTAAALAGIRDVGGDEREPQAPETVVSARVPPKPSAPPRRASTAQKKQRPPEAPEPLDDADAGSQIIEHLSMKHVEESTVAHSFASWRPKASSPESESSERLEGSGASRVQTRHAAASSTETAFHVSSSRGALSLHMASHDDDDEAADQQASVDGSKKRRSARPQGKGRKGTTLGSSPESALSSEGDGDEEIVSESEENGVIAM